MSDEDRSAELIAQLQPQMASLIAAVPMLLTLGPNTEQLANMGRAMFQGSTLLPAASPVQAAYVQMLHELAGAIRQASAAAKP